MGQREACSSWEVSSLVALLSLLYRPRERAAEETSILEEQISGRASWQSGLL